MIRNLNKKIFHGLLLGLFLFGMGFSFSSGLFDGISENALEKLSTKIGPYFNYHLTSLGTYPEAKRHLLLSGEEYTQFYAKGLSWRMVFIALSGALFNSLFQPLFLCVFTPQVILNFLLFPFFIYGVLKYFREVPIIILVFFALYLHIGMHDSVVEPIVRHRMACEQIYLLMGLAGLVGWITKSSS